MVRNITFGIIIDDIVFPNGDTQMGVLGGGGPQTAWGMAAALGSGEAVGLVAGVGYDLNAEVLAPMHAAKIDLVGMRETAQPTPRAWQILEYDGHRTQLWRVPPSTLGVQLARNWDVLPPTYQEARTFHWGIHPGDPDAAKFAQELRARGKLVSLEPFRPPDEPLSDEALGAILQACDVFSPNWREAQRMTGHTEHHSVLARFRQLGAQILAIRRGADGAEIWHLDEGRGVRVPAIKTSVVDAVGAGNAFCGALIVRLQDGIESAACHASAAASYLIEQVGLPTELPHPNDFAQRLDQAQAGLRPITFDHPDG